MIHELIDLYKIFFRIGLFSIGGGYVMFPMLRREMVEDRAWISDEELLDYYAIAQATPGIIAINTATFVGFKRRGVWGAFAATAGMVTPSLIIITIIAIFFSRLQDNPVVQRAFRGIRVAVAVLLSFTVVSLMKKTVRGALAVMISAGAFLGITWAGFSPIPILLSAAVLGILTGIAGRKKSAETIGADGDGAK